MNSYIFTSSACKACDETPFETNERQVLRTTSEDICCTCGSVLQTFPPLSGFEGSDKFVPIPAPVSMILEELLKRRLFIVGRGGQPSRCTVSPFDQEKMAKTLAHRVGDQVLLELRGHGNCSAELRWSYSVKSKIPGITGEDLTKIKFPRPARIVRACDVLSRMHYMGAFVDGHRRQRNSMRFEERVGVQTQVLDTTEELCLVIKVQINWLQVGNSFSDETGARIFGLNTNYRGFPLTAEEAVDLAISQCMYGERGNGTIYAFGKDWNGYWQVETADHPLALHERLKYYAEPQKPELFGCRLAITNREEEYRGAFKSDDGRRLALSGCQYDLEISFAASRNHFDRDKSKRPQLPKADVTVTCGEKVIAQQSFGGPDYQGSYSTEGFRIGYRFVLRELLTTEVGQQAKVSIVTETGTEEMVFCFVSKAEYQASWDSREHPIIDQYKRQLLSKIALRLGRGTEAERIINNGASVAALIQGQWLEGTYEGTTAIKTHLVHVRDRAGLAEWEVSTVKLLAVALSEGLHVAAPYNPDAPSGTQAKFVRSVSVKELSK